MRRTLSLAAGSTTRTRMAAAWRRSRSRTAAPALALAFLLLLSACEEGGNAGDPLAPDPAARELSDGNDGGDYDGFVWLPPLVNMADRGGQEPVPGLAPRVVICEVVQDVGGWYCGEVIRAFEPGGVVYDEDHYKVEWDTGAPDYAFEPSLDLDDPENVYRISVHLGSRLLGFADVALGETGGAAKKLTSDGVVGIKHGRTMPLNFFLGTGLEEDLCGDGYDCRIGTAYHDQDNAFITRDGDAALFLPATALPEGGPYTVLIRELPASECEFAFPADLPAGSTLPEFPACYEYTLDPDPVLTDFATVGQCVDRGAVAAYEGVTDPDALVVEERIDELQLGARHSADAAERPAGVAEYELLENVPAPLPLSCDDYEAGPASTGVAAIVRGVTRSLTELFVGRAAYAGHIGLGGAARELSIVQWVDPGLRIAGFDSDRGGFISPLGQPLSDALDLLVAEYGYVTRSTADSLQRPGVLAAPDASDVAPLLHEHIDLVLIGTVETNTGAIEPLDPAYEQPALATFVDAGGCAILLPDNDTFGGAGTDVVNESLLDPFGLDITGTLGGQQTAVVTAAGTTHPATAGITSFLQNFPGWFDGTGGGTILAENPGGPAMVAIAGGQGSYGSSGPVFAFSDANQFFGTAYAGKLGTVSNQQLFVQTVAACGTEPPAPAPE
ncbi:MAG: hypothetical protein ACLFRX_05105 [Gemmatimonadota bacterium]